MFDKIKYSNGKKENEGLLIKRNIGLGRGRRKKAAKHLDLKWDEYRQAEELLLENSKRKGDENRLKDMFIGRRRSKNSESLKFT